MNNTPALAEPQKEKKTIRTLLEDKTTLAKMRQIIPAHLNPERMLRIFAMAIYKTPKLAQCDPISLLGAMMACASFGLEPNTPLGHAYLIPFDKNKKVGNQWVLDRIDVQLIIGYRGYIDLARRSGTMVSIHADVVYEGDDFSFEYGSNMHLRHVPKGVRIGRKSTYCYAHAKLIDGEAFEVLPNEDVLRIRDGAQAYKTVFAMKERNLKSYESTPWVAYEHEMKSKTMIRRLAKILPMSIEFANAVALDAMSEANKVDFTAYSEGDMEFVDIGFTDNNDDIPHIEASDEQPINIGVPPPSATESQTAQAELIPQAKLKAQPKATKPRPQFFSVFDSDGVAYSSGITLDQAAEELMAQLDGMPQGAGRISFITANKPVLQRIIENSQTYGPHLAALTK